MFLELGRVPGYRQAEVLFQGTHSQVVAATRLSDGLPVALKILAADESTERAVLAQARQELELTRRAAGPGVVTALGLERAGLEPALVLERIDGPTLRSRLAGKPLSLETFFQVALPLAQALARVHAARVIHRDLKPENVLLSASGSPTLIDFGIAVVLPRGQEELREPGVLEGSLQYLAPEQSGRMNRGVDRRTDLYALGIMLYEMLTGQPPFASAGEDPLALVHAHLTRPPPPLADQRGRDDLPPALEEIVLRLLAKQPEERYQSARGLVLDLERAARAARREGHDDDPAIPFPLSAELPDHLVFTGQLHGRSEVREGLEEAFAEARAGLPSLVLLTGPTGIGKTAHAEELRATVTEGGGLWGQGRFTLAQHHLPYSGLRQSLGGVCERLLMEPEAELRRWQTSITEALGPVAAVAVEVVPELQRLIGSPPPVAELGPAETRHRFVLAMRRLLGALATAQRPLVLFLDDLPEADPASLQLLEELIAGPSPQWWMVLATAADAHPPGSPLLPLATRAAERERLREIAVPPLSTREMTDWLAELLRRPAREVEGLASVLGRKTGDNPLFVQQLLRLLEETDRLRLDGQGRWSWDEDEVAAAELPDDLAEVLRGQLASVKEEARRVAGWASVIGGPFTGEDLDALSPEVGQGPSVDVPAALAALAEAGLVVMRADSYRFAHPSLQQAALEPLPESERRSLHARLGWRRLGSEQTQESADAPTVFAIADHFQAGYVGSADEAAALELPRRRQVVAALRRAGERALGSTAYATAIHYLEAAASLTDPGLAADRPAEAFAVELGLAKALFLAGRREDGEAAFQRLAARQLPPRLAARAHSAHVALLTYGGELDRAVQVGLGALRALGLRFGRKPSPLTLLPRLAGVLLRLRRRTDEALLEGARTEDDRVEAAAMIIDAVGPAAYWSDARLYASMHLANMRLQLGSGYAASISYAFAKQALLSGGLLHDIPAALRMARLSRDIQERLPCPQYTARIATLMLMTVEAWVRPLAEVAAELPAATRACEEAGDLEYASYSASLRMGLALASGMNLRTLREELADAARRCSLWGYKEVAAVEIQGARLVELLLGEGQLDEADPIGLGAVSFAQTKAPLYMHTTRALLVLYFLDRPADCFRHAQQTRDFARALPGQSLVMEHHFWHGMAAAAVASSGAADSDDADLARRELRRVARELARESRRCPENNLARCHLIDGEQHRLDGRAEQALRSYGLAAEQAGRRSVVHLEALAHERRGTLLAELGRSREAEIFLAQAYDAYRSWGARGQCQRLETAHPFLQQRRVERASSLSRRAPPGPSRAAGSTGSADADASQSEATSQRVNASALDVDTLVSATQAISEERTVEGVLRRLLAAALANAGAERGVLILRREGLAIVEAEYDGAAGFSRLGVPLEAYDRLPTSALRLVERTGDRLVLGNASRHDVHGQDEYVQKARVRSLLAAPIVRQGVVAGLLYLENNAVADAFTPERVELLQLLATQAAISLDNAQLYSGLEAKVDSRTRQLDARNRQLRLVLDNVEQGFLTVDRSGNIVGERSAVVERWLGAIEEGTPLSRALSRVDAAVAQRWSLGWEALIEDILPFEVLMDQLPRRFSLASADPDAPAERVFELAYRPLHEEPAAASGAGFSQMLVVISDVTESLARQSSERSQRELVEIFQRIVRDRPGVEEFRAEASLLVMAISGGLAGPMAELKRALHTLKGNAGLFGLTSLADLCAAAETDIEEEGELPPPSRLREIRSRWQEIDTTLSSFLGVAPRDTVELRPAEVEDLLAALERGEPPAVLSTMIRGWARESMVDRLARIADQVRRLGRAAGKGEVRVFTEPNDLRLDGDAWASFWSALVHVLRNAVDHGLETPAERAAAGKLQPPTVVVRTFISGESLVIEVADDGRGVAWERIAARAREAGLPAETQEHLVAALFSDGLSTGDGATELSGRGVGAGAVRAECESRGGRVEVRSERGRGTTFAFIFPLRMQDRGATPNPLGMSL